jgi:hypothetical protein
MPATPAQPDDETVARHLARLTTAYPAFNFSRELFGWKGCRWVAERRDRSVSGLRVVITDDLMEMHATLRRDRDRCPFHDTSAKMVEN